MEVGYETAKLFHVQDRANKWILKKGNEFFDRHKGRRHFSLSDQHLASYEGIYSVKLVMSEA
jgi:hypothetical protein